MRDGLAHLRKPFPQAEFSGGRRGEHGSPFSPELR
jgi:hypothetical protein